jgi:hypothetical protein
MDWVLVVFLCLQWTATEPVCKERQLHMASKAACAEMMDPTAAATSARAGQVGANVLFLSTVCRRGRDA